MDYDWYKHFSEWIDSILNIAVTKKKQNRESLTHIDYVPPY